MPWFQIEFNTKGSFKPMINKIQSSNYATFNNIKRIACYNNMRLNSAATWSLAQPTIQAIIEFGVKFYTHEAKTIKERLFNWQYKIARFALGARSSTPKRYLEMELNFEPIELRYRKTLLRFYEQCARAPMTSIKNKVMRKWIEYRNEQDYSQMNFLASNMGMTFHNKSALSRAWFLKNIIEDTDDTDWQSPKMNEIKESKYSLPCYLIPHPMNIVLYMNVNEIIDDIKNENSFTWWTDGSVIDDGYGGFGYVTLQHRQEGKMIANYGWIEHKTNIDYCELSAIDAALDECVNDDNILKNDNFEYITIMTDSLFCMYMCDMKRYCKFEYYYDILQNIFKKCTQLKKYGKTIRMVKIPAHSGYTGNELADYWAKYASRHARKIDYNNDSISNNEVPLIVQCEINDAMINDHYYEKRERLEELKRNARERKGKQSINSSLYDGIRRTKYLKREKAYMSFNETAIIVRLRTEHIELNKYNNIIYAYGKQTDSKCNECKVDETVTHFICKCKRYANQRKWLYDELCKCNSAFRNKNEVLDIKRLLFPHQYQGKPGKHENLMMRIKILKLVCKYVSMTKRFINDDVKSKIFINNCRENDIKISNDNESDNDEPHEIIEIFNEICESNEINNDRMNNYNINDESDDGSNYDPYDNG